MVATLAARDSVLRKALEDQIEALQDQVQDLQEKVAKRELHRKALKDQVAELKMKVSDLQAAAKAAEKKNSERNKDTKRRQSTSGQSCKNKWPVDLRRRTRKSQISGLNSMIRSRLLRSRAAKS